MATREERIASTLAIAHAVMGADALEEHKRAFLSSFVWMMTEVDGKYGVPYWSEGVWNLVEQHGGLPAVLKLRPMPIRHEHVNTRKSLVDKIMDDPTCMEAVLREESLACLVTVDEHPRLSNKIIGFERYTSAGIRVWDVTKQSWKTENG